MKATVIRFMKDTIKRMYWEMCITECQGVYLLWKAHIPKGGGEYTDMVEEIVTKEYAQQYEEMNKQHIVERYETTLNEDIHKLLIDTIKAL